MKSSLYSISVVVRVILIGLNCFLLVWFFVHTNRPATTLFILIVLAIQVGGLIYYHNRVVRDLANFLVFLEENDTTLAFSEKRIERSFKGIAFNLNKINQKLQHAKIEKEKQFHYLQTVVKQIDTGIIAWDQDGKIEIFNRAASELMGIRFCTTIDELTRHNPELAELFAESVAPVISPLIITRGQGQLKLAIKIGTMRFDNRTVKLISMQNIKPELDAGELDAWRKLIRIQRHEIINSITPITTLTTAIKRRFIIGHKFRNIHEITEENIHDIMNSVDVIEERSRGLIDFVERFKNLTDIPRLKCTTFKFKTLAERIIVLFSKERSGGTVNFNIDINPENLLVYGDEKLLEQVLINLVKNAIEAMMPDGGNVAIRSFRNLQNSSIIEVADDGPGIEPACLESIFVPSYTTKENGSGIGLSITRQIIQLHNGTIDVRSKPGVETVFAISLPQMEGQTN